MLSLKVRTQDSLNKRQHFRSWKNACHRPHCLASLITVSHSSYTQTPALQVWTRTTERPSPSVISLPVKAWYSTFLPSLSLACRSPPASIRCFTFPMLHSDTALISLVTPSCSAGLETRRVMIAMILRHSLIPLHHGCTWSSPNAGFPETDWNYVSQDIENCKNQFLFIKHIMFLKINCKLDSCPAIVGGGGGVGWVMWQIMSSIPKWHDR